MSCIVCKDMKEFDTLNDAIHEKLKKELRGYRATKWAEPLVHPNTGEIAMTLDDRAISCLAQAQKKRVKPLSEDWFPTPKDNGE